MHPTAIRIVSIVFGLLSVVVIGLNLLTDRDEFWAIWPIWAFAMIAGAVIVSLKMRHVPLGIWLGGGFFLVLGLVVIDLTDGNGWWAFWPAGAWIILSALFTALTVDLLAGIPTTNPQRHPDER
ncbi:MAG: hypothetical protein H0V37_14140 [Chloroflexia bacterium]|nr:hypothetical protein [Chloroflexia bacterium]